MSKYSLGVIGAWLLTVIVASYAVLGHERTLREGELVLLRLAPVDPRSLMQGDYMALRFAVDDHLQTENGKWPAYAHLHLGAGARATFAGTGQAPSGAPGQVSMRIRPGTRGASLGPNGFFFQEGHAARYEQARWGGFRVAADGTALLASLYSEDLELLGNNRR